ncbi:MAG: penicillin-binding protein 2 [Anaerolineae bacterium]
MDRRLLPFQGWRLTFFRAVMIAIFVLFSIRMYDLQVASYSTYQAAAEENRLNQLPLAADRGVIFDRYDRPLARNVPAFNVTIVPAALPDDTKQVHDINNRISALVDVPPTAAIAAVGGRRTRSIEEMVNTGRGIAPFREVVIARDVDFHVALQLREENLSLPGVDVKAAPVREYPTGELTSHIIGYMAPIPPEEAQSLIEQGYDPAFDRIGVDGIEAFLNDELAGKRGSLLREIDVAGATIKELERIEPLPGENVRLTIDSDLQQAAENALKDRIALLNSTYNRLVSQQGVVIAMNPQNGQILSMVSYPGYDNSRFARTIDVTYYEEVANDPLRPLVNNATRSLYPPGSVWKLITASGVLQEGVIAPQSALFDPGSIVVENKYAPNDPAASQTFVCWKRDGHGSINIWGAIAQSCNVYFYQVGGGNPDVSELTLRRGGLGIDDLFRYATAYGIGSELGVELPGENRGRMPDPTWKRLRYGENWSTGDTYNAALGQGYVNVTPLQLVNMAATVANGGTLYQPTIIESFLDPEGNVVKPFTPQVLRNVDLADVNGTLTLLLVEDMIMKGPDSLDCMCENESDNPYYKSVRCDPAGYRNTVDLSPLGDGSEIREYKVHIPDNYVFNARLCYPPRFDDKYRPAFVSQANLQIIQEGMRSAVTIGTAQKANLPYVEVAGKTGTAQYCDNIANGLGLCKFGSWPAHAWFVAFAPYENPEIVVAGFIYNGTEGSLWALPVVRDVLEAYYRLKNERAGIPPPPAVEAIGAPPGPSAPDALATPVTGG